MLANRIVPRFSDQIPATGAPWPRQLRSWPFDSAPLRPTAVSDLALSAYVRADPINSVDPRGTEEEEIVVTATRGATRLLPYFGDQFAVVASQAYGDSVVVTAFRKKKLGKKKLRMNSGSEEFYKTNPEGEIEKIKLDVEKVDCGNGSELLRGRLPRGAITGDDIRAIHTHGFSGLKSGLPGPGDAGIPLKFGVPLYGITNYGAWRVDASEGSVSITLLEGDWGPGGENFDSSTWGKAGHSGTTSSTKELCKKAGG